MILFVAFVFPLALYCLVLGFINRRERPLLVPGTWDFAGILFAASGLLLFIGPGMMAALHERWRLFLLLGQRRYAPNFADEDYYFWLFLSLLYFAAVLTFAVVMLRRRRLQTAVYNVEPPALEMALVQALDRLGLTWGRSGNQFLIRPSGREGKARASRTLATPQHGYPDPSLRENVAAEADQGEALAGAASTGVAIVELEPFPGLCHVTMRWRLGEPNPRQEIERELAVALSHVTTQANTASGWFFSLFFLLLFASCLAMFMLILANLRMLR